MSDIQVTIGPVTHQNPVFVASGICGYGEEYSPLLSLGGLGGVVTKTITIRPRKGNDNKGKQRFQRGPGVRMDHE